MSEEQNRAIVRRFFEEVWNQQKDDVTDEVFASTIIFNGQAITRDALKQALAGRRNAFSDIRFSQGRIVEDWAVADELSILQPIGASPT
jgi:predicted ester cyclase